MIKPIAKWDHNGDIIKGLVWYSRLDNQYQIEVQDTSGKDRTGILAIFDHKDKDKLIHKEPVSLAYGAMFGPDMADVESWKRRSCDIVDHPELRLIS